LKRLLLKLSGEALAGDGGFGIAPARLAGLVEEIGALQAAGGQLGVVLGGGNLLRGASLAEAGVDRVSADQMGMLATVMNGLAFRDQLDRAGIPCDLLSAIELPGVAERYHVSRARSALATGRVQILTAGTGNPFFTTDTAACLRAIELEADAVLKATKVDGVYSADPHKDPDARRYERLSYAEVLERQLGVMDLTAIVLCRDHALPLVVFDMHTSGALTALVKGENVGTLVTQG